MIFSHSKWKLELGVAGTILNSGDTVDHVANAAATAPRDGLYNDDRRI